MSCRGKRDTGLSGTIHAVKPGNAQGTGFLAHIDPVSDVKTIEVVGVDGQSLDFSAFPPGLDKEAAGAADNAFHLVAPNNDGGMISNTFRRIESAIEEDAEGKKEGNWNQPREKVAEDFDIFAVAGLTVEEDRDGEGSEEDQSEEDEHRVEVKRRIDLAEVREEQRTKQKECHLANEAATENKFRRSGGQPAVGTLIAGAL